MKDKDRTRRSLKIIQNGSKFVIKLNPRAPVVSLLILILILIKDHTNMIEITFCVSFLILLLTNQIIITTLPNFVSNVAHFSTILFGPNSQLYCPNSHLFCQMSYLFHKIFCCPNSHFFLKSKPSSALRMITTCHTVGLKVV